ncbi:MAG: VWA domain-containing protein [Planctomycetaceae bacterium]
MTTPIELEWTRPSMLWLLAIAAPWLVWFHHRSLSDFSRLQRAISLLIRTCMVTLIVLSLAGLVLLVSTQRQMIVVAVDQSESIDAAATAKASEFIATLQAAPKSDRETEIRFLRFAQTPGLTTSQWHTSDQPPSDQPESPSQDNSPVIAAASHQPLALGTDIASAIRAAMASIPPSYVAKVVVVSDGNSTTGDEIATAASAGIPISTVTLPQRSEPEVQIAAIEAPAQVRQGEPFYIEIVVNANAEATGYIDLYRGDIKIGDEEQKPVTVKAGETRFRIRQSVVGQRQVTFAARMRGFGAGDTLLDNNEAIAIVAAAGRPRVLVVDPDVDQTDSLRWALNEQSIDIEVRPPDGVPRDLSELQGYECLVLSNVPATAMTMRQMDLIRSYVQDLGGGLIMLGGDQSFGLGGYYRTQLEEILPVRSNFEKEREKPSLAMVLVIDKSGSMGGEKIELAKDAARAAVELLGPRDSVGVIAFESSSYWISELRSASDKDYLMDQISTIDAAGGTDMYPAMEDAYRALAAAPAKLKHCILLTDGISAPGDFEGLASEMALAKMTVSTVAMGDGASEEMLQDIARLGGGRYYFCDDPQSVPQVFAKETVEASKSAINELPFLPQLIRPTQVLEGIDLELAPLLLGYVVTRPKPTSEFILASENGDPLLAWWRYGLGMTVAFTSDAKARWAAEWLAWPDFGPFWAQVIRHAMRKNDTQGIFVEVKSNSENTTVIMDAVDNQGNFFNEQPTTLTMIDPQLKTHKLEMRQTAPGRYEASVKTERRGSYQLDLAQRRGESDAVRQSRGLVVGYPEELRLRPVNVASMRAMAEASGGQFMPSATQLLSPDDRTARKPVPLWPYLLIASLCLFVADVTLRRIELI